MNTKISGDQTPAEIGHRLGLQYTEQHPLLERLAIAVLVSGLVTLLIVWLCR